MQNSVLIALIVIIGFVGAIAGNLIAAWIQKVVWKNAFSGFRITVTIVVAVVAIILTIILQNQLSTPTVNKFCEEEGTVTMEAENFTDMLPGSGKGASSIVWKEVKDSKYSNSIALQALPIGDINTGIDINGPALLYQIKFQKAGAYYVYILGSGPAGNKHDSVHVGLSGKAVTAVDTTGTGVGFGDSLTWESRFCVKSEEECIEMDDVTIQIPDSGTHIFYMWMREDGVIIDKLILSQYPIEGDIIKGQMKENQCIN